jgi:alkanesulfonate monooxygenase SsuD/methylene tetrahydromethanopterin reductase-like flavin-dependent oxidoreductase (luciferase family)
MTIDRLSGGRLVLPVGLGATDDSGFGRVGEPTDAKTRAELMDESLAILDGLWSGGPFAFEGRHYRFRPMTFQPTPVQRPRIPVWVVGAWPNERSMRRVLQWDGIVTQTDAVDEIRAIVEYVERERPTDRRDQPFEVVVQGRTAADDPVGASETIRPYAEAGATWWIEADWEAATVDSVRQRVLAGPPAGGVASQ